MKVKIGPYRNNNVSAHRLLFKLRDKGYLSDPEDELWKNVENGDIFPEPPENWADKTANGIQWFLDTFWNNPLSILKDRVIYVRIDDYDVWNLDDTLAHIILPALKLMKSVKQGAPDVDLDDVPEALRSTSLSEEDGTDIHYFARWEWVVNEMIWAFEQKLHVDWADQYTSGELVSYNKVYDKDQELVSWETDEEKSTYKIDTEGMAAHQKRMTNGFRLFGKYYENLWT